MNMLNEQFLNECRNGNQKAVKDLIPSIDIHYRDEQAMYIACAYGNGQPEIVKILLRAGSDPSALGHLPFRAANEFGHEDIVQILMDANAYDVYSFANVIRNPFVDEKMKRLILSNVTYQFAEMLPQSAIEVIIQNHFTDAVRLKLINSQSTSDEECEIFI